MSFRYPSIRYEYADDDDTCMQQFYSRSLDPSLGGEGILKNFDNPLDQENDMGFMQNSPCNFAASSSSGTNSCKPFGTFLGNSPTKEMRLNNNVLSSRHFSVQRHRDELYAQREVKTESHLLKSSNVQQRKADSRYLSLEEEVPPDWFQQRQIGNRDCIKEPCLAHSHGKSSCKCKISFQQHNSSSNIYTSSSELYYVSSSDKQLLDTGKPSTDDLFPPLLLNDTDTNIYLEPKIEVNNDDIGEICEEDFSSSQPKKPCRYMVAKEEFFDEKKEKIDELVVASNGWKKPPLSYSCMIGLAMKNSETGELTVSEIYAFLCEHFPYFEAAPSGWKNSIRHNLSLNKCFQKIEVEIPDQQSRKSCLWRINPNRVLKMDKELRKWRARDEEGILFAMTKPHLLDALQEGQVGMPQNIYSSHAFAEFDFYSKSSYLSDESFMSDSTQPKVIVRRLMGGNDERFKIYTNGAPNKSAQQRRERSKIRPKQEAKSDQYFRKHSLSENFAEVETSFLSSKQHESRKHINYSLQSQTVDDLDKLDCGLNVGEVLDWGIIEPTFLPSPTADARVQTELSLCNSNNHSFSSTGNNVTSQNIQTKMENVKSARSNHSSSLPVHPERRLQRRKQTVKIYPVSSDSAINTVTIPKAPKQQQHTNKLFHRGVYENIGVISHCSQGSKHKTLVNTSPIFAERQSKKSISAPSTHEHAARKLESLLNKRVSDEYTPLGSTLSGCEETPPRKASGRRRSRNSTESLSSKANSMHKFGGEFDAVKVTPEDKPQQSSQTTRDPVPSTSVCVNMRSSNRSNLQLDTTLLSVNPLISTPRDSASVEGKAFVIIDEDDDDIYELLGLPNPSKKLRCKEVLPEEGCFAEEEVVLSTCENALNANSLMVNCLEASQSPT